MKESLRTNSGDCADVNFYKIYYKNSKALGNLCTVCLLFDADENIISRGVAICSLKDIHRKATGRNIAIGRAIKAKENRNSFERILSNRDDKAIIRNIKTTAEDFAEILEDLKNYPLVATKKIKMNNEEFLRLVIPIGLPIWETMKLFKFKSEYKPVLTEEEKKIVVRKKSLK